MLAGYAQLENFCMIAQLQQMLKLPTQLSQLRPRTTASAQIAETYSQNVAAISVNAMASMRCTACSSPRSRTRSALLPPKPHGHRAQCELLGMMLRRFCDAVATRREDRYLPRSGP